MQARTQARNCLAEAIKASHGARVNPQSMAEEKVKKTREKSEGKSKGTEGAIQVSKGSGNGKTLKTGISDHENLKSETSWENQESVQMGQVCITETSLIHEEWSPDDRNNDWSLNEWNEEGSCVGWHEDYERMCCTTASSFPLESSERVTADRDTRSSGNTFPVQFDREGAGDGNSYYWILGVEACQFQGYDEKCQTGSLNGRLADAHQVLGSNALAFEALHAASDVHKVRCNVAETVSKEQQYFYVEYDGGYMIQIHSKICQGTRSHFEKLFNEYGMSDLVPVYLEKDALNFYLNREVKSEEIHSLNDTEQCLEKGNQQSGNEYGRAVSS